MRESTIARSYAEALLALGEKQGEVDAYGTWLGDLAAMLEADPRMRAFFASPKIPARAKQAALREAFSGRVSPLFLNFLQLVVQKRRQGLFDEIAVEYQALVDRKEGRVHVDVTLAHAPDAAAGKQLEDKLSAALGKKVVSHVRVNPDLLGGVIVRYGDKVLDGSVRRQLMTMRRQLIDADL